MGVTWIKKFEESGKATLGSNYIVINKLFADKFKTSFIAVVGLDENNNLMIKPLTLDESESPLYKDSLQAKISVFDTFVRIGNVSTMKTIAKALDAELSKKGVKCDTMWNDEEKALKIETGGIK